MKTWVEISRQNILHNISEIKKLLKPGVSLMAVIKSNAYGHGISEVAKILTSASSPCFREAEIGGVSARGGSAWGGRGGKSTGIDWFGVDSIDEALILKKILLRQGFGGQRPILILGYIPLLRLKEAVKNGFRFVVYNYETIKVLSKIHNLKSIIHLKAETGTSRQGIGENEILDFVKFIKKFPNIKIEGFYTHFANIEDTTDHSYAEKQLNKFNKMIKLLEKTGISIPVKHSACSAATILFPETHFNLVRLGISMYGMWSSKETFISAHPHLSSPSPREGEVGGGGILKSTSTSTNIILKPALTWKTVVAQIKNIKNGTPVSYGLTEKVNRDSKIAVLPVGYWDGFDRGLSSIGNVLIKGKGCKVLGRVCMNMCVVDVTDVPGVKVEDEVVLIGSQGKEKITAEEFAAKLGTINYEVVTKINPLIKRVII